MRRKWTPTRQRGKNCEQTIHKYEMQMSNKRKKWFSFFDYASWNTQDIFAYQIKKDKIMPARSKGGKEIIIFMLYDWE